MNKSMFALSLLGLMVSCINNSSTTQKTPVSVDSTAIKLATISTQTDSISKSDFDFNSYLNKNNFEQGSVDSSTLIIVKPTQAIFVFTKLDSSEPNSLKEFQVIRFTKKLDHWIKTIDTPFSDLEVELNKINTNYRKWEITDINGDGLKDVLLKIDHDGRQNKSYECFLQDTLNKKFVQIEKFREISNPEYDSKNKVLLSTNSYHHGQDTETYKWEGSKLKFIKGETAGEIEKKYFKKDGW